MAGLLHFTLSTGAVPVEMADAANWPEQMQAEWADLPSAAARHRELLVESFRRLRARLDEFEPDFVLVWGDDQYEQFQEETVPPFNVFIFDEVESQPFLVDDPTNPGDRNVWGEPADKVFVTRGHRQGASYIAQRLLDSDFDIAYSYSLRQGHPLPHSFLNTQLFLDYDRVGFDYPVVPFHVNCYGSTVIRSRGAVGHLTGNSSAQPWDPSSPSPRRCFDLGRAVARIVADSPWRVALVGSSSWSHAFLTEKNGWVYPDVKADRRAYERLEAQDFEWFRSITTKEIEDRGQQELLNWVCLAGAAHELGWKPSFLDYVESYVFNSDKCAAILE